jgi:hypothetical protein
MKDREKMPAGKPETDVPAKPHEFPEYEDMPTNVDDDKGAGPAPQTPGKNPQGRLDVSNESADITNE